MRVAHPRSYETLDLTMTPATIFLVFLTMSLSFKLSTIAKHVLKTGTINFCINGGSAHVYEINRSTPTLFPLHAPYTSSSLSSVCHLGLVGVMLEIPNTISFSPYSGQERARTIFRQRLGLSFSSSSHSSARLEPERLTN